MLDKVILWMFGIPQSMSFSFLLYSFPSGGCSRALLRDSDLLGCIVANAGDTELHQDAVKGRRVNFSFYSSRTQRLQLILDTYCPGQRASTQ